MLDVMQRIDHKLGLLVHKTLTGQSPNYITDLLTPVANIPIRSSMHASRNGDLFLLRIEWRINGCALSVTAPHAWNQLPTEMMISAIVNNDF